MLLPLHTQQVGEVMGGKDDGGSGATLGKRMHTDGKEYDYLFDIDMNGAPMKIPFNRGTRVQYTCMQAHTHTNPPSLSLPHPPHPPHTRAFTPNPPPTPLCGHHQATTLG